MSEPKKCEHKPCTCMVPKDGPYGDYCSEHCKTAGHKIELVCECHHPGCK
jgi:hypothetical protein